MTEDVVFQSCKRMFHSRFARFTQSDTGEVGQQSEVGNLHASQRRQTTQSPISSVVPDFRFCFPQRGVRLWTISLQRKTDSATQSNGVRARWFHGLRSVSQADLQQIFADRHGPLYVTGYA